MECRVCDATTNGFHYKIPTCRACAAFFRRTIQMKLRYKCRYQGDCSVSKHTRFSCRHCRMKKCLVVGMVAEEGDVPQEFYLDESDPEASTSDLPTLLEDPFFSKEAIFGDNETFIKKLKQRMYKILSKKYQPSSASCDMYIMQQADLAYREHEEKWPCSQDTIDHNPNLDMNQFIVYFYKELQVVANFCSAIKPYAQLPLDQKALLFKHFFCKFCQLDRVAVAVRLLGTDRDDSRMLTINGQVIDFHNSKFDLSMVTDFTQDQLKDILLFSEIRFDEEFIKPFKLLNPDRFEVLYMIMRALWDVRELKGVSKETEAVAATVLEKLSDELSFYYKYEKQLEKTASRIYKIQNLLVGLERVSEMRRQDSQMVQVFEIFKMDVYLSDFTID